MNDLNKFHNERPLFDSDLDTGKWKHGTRTWSGYVYHKPGSVQFLNWRQKVLTKTSYPQNCNILTDWTAFMEVCQSQYLVFDSHSHVKNFDLIVQYPL